jgi:hypothetical protein
MGEYFENCNQAPMISQQHSLPESDVQEVDAAQFAPTNQGKKKGTCKWGKAFHPDEDKVICSAWLNISKDSTIGLSSL